MILHEDPRSGNCYKIRLTAALLGIPLQFRAYDIMNAETRTPVFLANVNGNGRIPVLQDGDKFLPESNAACFYLAEGSGLIPDDRFERADMLRWMFWEQYNHEPNVATLRFWMAFVGEDALNDLQRALLPGKREQGDAALALMDKQLASRRWFVGDRISLADIALYAYTHVSDDGGFNLKAYAHIGDWMERIASEPGYVPMNKETPLAVRGPAD
ncbi:glutathione S-transferase family protein [Sphingomonas alba]|uniref:Glutathione S-transferase family protein n=1 Tax=Sphingomonas alba TaxID=2908208 RepID=A0ABT0RP29_9SPHN|nr:glutathione S-transferase family protein [Sphingomonas alba]